MKAPAIITFCLLICCSCLDESWTKEETPGGCGVADVYEPRAPQPYVFKAQCAACHSLDKDGTGPKLNGILDRVPSEEWLIQFITNQDSLVLINDSCTLEIMRRSPVKWNHNFNDIPKEDLDTLMTYITQ